LHNLLLKKDLSAEQLAMVNSEMNKRQKSKGIVYALWWFTGIFGGHRFYVGDTGRAIGMLLFGIFTLYIWNLVDVFLIGKRIEERNEEIEREIITNVKAFSNVTKTA